MKKWQKSPRVLLEIAGGVLIVVLALSTAYFYLKSEILALNCGDFRVPGNLFDAQESLKMGNTHLDGDGDGEACE